MKLDVKTQLLKFCSAVLNAVFLVLGVSVTACAAWLLFDTGSFFPAVSSEELRTVGAGLLLIGGVVMAVSIMGCVGAHLENRLLLLIYVGVLVVLLLGQLFVTLLLLINARQIQESLDEAVDRIVHQYGSGNNEDRLIDGLQRFAECCGRTGSSDWLKNSFIQNVNNTNILPCSCFQYHSLNSLWCSNLLNFTEGKYGQGNNLYEQGCEEELSGWLRENTLTISAMNVSLMFIQVLQFVLAIFLYRAFGQKAALRRTNQRVDDDHAHLDHTPDSDYSEQIYAYMNDDYDHIDSTHPPLYHEDHLSYHHDNQNLHRIHLEVAQSSK